MPDIFSGLVIGVLQSAIGHPFDTAKTLLQNGQNIKTLTPLQLYRGAIYPTIASIAYNGIAFQVFDCAYDKHQNPFIAGALSGIAVGPVDFAFNVGKIRKQTLTNIPIHTKGFVASYTRNIIASTLYFGVYFNTTDHVGSLAAGACAGLANWTATYPLDVISTRQVAQGLCFRDACYGSLWNGYAACALRAVLVNSATFYCYEWLKKEL